MERIKKKQNAYDDTNVMWRWDLNLVGTLK